MEVCRPTTIRNDQNPHTPTLTKGRKIEIQIQIRINLNLNQNVQILVIFFPIITLFVIQLFLGRYSM